MEINFSETLDEALEAAEALEDTDQHLSTEERQALVNLFKQENPGVELPANLDDAFVHLLYDLA